MSIIDLIPDVVYRLDNNGKIVFISNSISQYGYNPDELTGTSMIDLVHPDDRDKALFKVNERRTGERRTNLFQIRLLKKCETPVPFEVASKTISSTTAFLINAEGIYIPDSDDNTYFDGTQGIARDITVRKAIGNKLEIDEERYYFILNRLEDGFFEIDPDGKFLFVNDSLARIMGYEKNEMTGSLYSDFLVSELKKETVLDFQKFLTGSDENKMISLKVRRKDGKGLLLEGFLSAIINKEGEPEGFMGIVKDITSKKKIEEDLFRARKLEAIGIFSGGIAHDYNNALTTIIGNIALAKMELQGGNTNVLEILDDAENASLKVRDLTHKLSALSKGGKPVKKPTDIKGLLRDVIDTTLHDYEGELELKTADDLKMVEIDEFQIGHLIEYILTNSVEAMVDNCLIKVSAENIDVEKEESHHEITLQTGEYVKISIEDNGHGIDPEDIEMIFDPYFTTKESRSGMGLAISYAVIKRHNGYIDVKSVKGEGAVFSIYLPVNL
jgi:PAS domain S-box-containing protein